MMIKYELVKKLIYEIIANLEQEEKEIKRNLQAYDYTIQGYTQEIDDWKALENQKAVLRRLLFKLNSFKNEVDKNE